jgi:hypothetical protein
MLIKIIACEAPKTCELICYLTDISREQKLLTFTNANDVAFPGEDVNVA